MFKNIVLALVLIQLFLIFWSIQGLRTELIDYRPCRMYNQQFDCTADKILIMEGEECREK